MPIYEYGCSECGKRIEAFQKIADEPLTTCPDCGGELSKLISNTSFVLKGGGWYADGYASTGDPAKASTTGAKDKSTTDSKTDKTPASKSKEKPSTPVSTTAEK